MTPELMLTSEPDGDVRSGIVDRLVAFNIQRAGTPSERTPLAVLIKAAGTEEVVGGLWGRTAWKWLMIETLFVPEGQRGSGIGSRVMALAEREAIRRGCVGAWLDTHSFQAPGFYERLGYQRFGEIEDYPPGQSRIFFLKRF